MASTNTVRSEKQLCSGFSKQQKVNKKGSTRKGHCPNTTFINPALAANY